MAGRFVLVLGDQLDRGGARNQRMTMQLKNLSRKSAADVRGIRRQADELRGQLS